MKAHIRIVVFILSVSMMPSLSSAQSRCPYGTEYAGTISGRGTDIEKLDRRDALKLPDKVTLDESYQQTKLTASNDRGKKSTNLRPQDVPKGILIIPSGSRDYPVRWAVSEPKLTAFERDKNGPSLSTNLEFTFSVRWKPQSLIGKSTLAMWTSSASNP